MRPSRTSEKVRVALETLLGSMEGKKILKMFSRMTMIQTEKAVTFRNRQKDTKQQMKSSLPLKASLQYIKVCDYPRRPLLFCTSSVPKAIMAVRGMMIITVPATLKAILINSLTSSLFLRVCVIVGMLWWNMKEKTRFEKMSPKYSILKKALPFTGMNVPIPPFWPMMMKAPRIIRKTEMNLTVMVMICSGLVFDMLLKEKAAPERKKRLSQNSKVFNTVTLAKSLERVLPVMMHLEMETPNRQMAMAIAGNNFHLQPYSTLNCSTWSTLQKSFPIKGFSSVESIKSLLSWSSNPSGLSVSARRRTIACMDSPTYMAELRLRAKMIPVQMSESSAPAQKKGSGTMMGPAPSSRLIAMKAALYLGTQKMALTLPVILLIRFIIADIMMVYFIMLRMAGQISIVFFTGLSLGAVVQQDLLLSSFAQSAHLGYA